MIADVDLMKLVLEMSRLLTSPYKVEHPLTLKMDLIWGNHQRMRQRVCLQTLVGPAGVS